MSCALQTLRVPTSITEQEEVQVEVTRLLVECYFDIVRANLQVQQLPLTYSPLSFHIAQITWMSKIGCAAKCSAPASVQDHTVIHL